MNLFVFSRTHFAVNIRNCKGTVLTKFSLFELRNSLTLFANNVLDSDAGVDIGTRSFDCVASCARRVRGRNNGLLVVFVTIMQLWFEVDVKPVSYSSANERFFACGANFRACSLVAPVTFLFELFRALTQRRFER